MKDLFKQLFLMAVIGLLFFLHQYAVASFFLQLTIWFTACCAVLVVVALIGLYDKVLKNYKIKNVKYNPLKHYFLSFIGFSFWISLTIGFEVIGWPVYSILSGIIVFCMVIISVGFHRVRRDIALDERIE